MIEKELTWADLEPGDVIKKNGQEFYIYQKTVQRNNREINVNIRIQELAKVPCIPIEITVN